MPGPPPSIRSSSRVVSSDASSSSFAMPGPSSRASQRPVWPASLSASSAEMPPPGVSSSPITRASGTAMARWGATLRQVAICSLPAPARSAPMPHSSAAPGTSTLPATTSTRPRPSLSSPSWCRGRGIERSSSGVTGVGAAHRAPTETSGSAVTGAPSSSSGAVKL